MLSLVGCRWWMVGSHKVILVGNWYENANALKLTTQMEGGSHGDAMDSMLKSCFLGQILSFLLAVTGIRDRVPCSRSVDCRLYPAKDAVPYRVRTTPLKSK